MRERGYYEKLKFKEKSFIGKYGSKRIEWEDEEDDRMLFCNIYDMVLTAMQDAQAISKIHVVNNYLRVALSNQIKHEIEVMDGIIERI